MTLWRCRSRSLRIFKVGIWSLEEDHVSDIRSNSAVTDGINLITQPRCLKLLRYIPSIDEALAG
jgi:hypothetical protein